jgi:hypothetical protein
MAVTPISVSPSLASVLNAAGDRNDVDFNYLLRTAMRESRLDPTARAASSSAEGLFQFTDSTWLQVMKAEGPRLGYQQYADAITRDGDGDYVIRDPKLRAKVLALRDNPAVAADMAAAFTKSNGDYLRAKFGRMPSPGELYIAHFLGAQGAEKMFDAGLRDPDQVAAALFPKAAAANPNIFYDHGQPRTIREVYKALVAGHSGAATLDPGFAAQQMAGGGQAVPGQVAVSYPVPLAPLESAGGNSRPVTADANAVPDIPSRIGPGDLDFDSMFSTAPEPRVEFPVSTASGSPLQAPTGAPVQAPEAGQGAFFTQLYGQK